MGLKLGITESEKTYLNGKLYGYLEQAYDLTDDNGSKFSDVFHALPLRANLEYYKVIKRPMSYSKVKMASKHRRYTHPQAFINDMVQIAWNAMFFNEESSDYYKCALILNAFIKNTLIPELKNDPKIFQHDDVAYPDLGPLPSASNNLAHNVQVNNTLTNGSINNANNDNTNSNINNNDIVETIVNNFNNHNNNITHINSTSTPTPTPMPEEDDEDDENNNDYEYQEDMNSFRQSSMQPYAPTSYVSTIEDTGRIHLYDPPRISTGGTISNRQMLEQWVKRGRPPVVDKPHEQRIKSIMRGLKKIKVGNKTMVSFWDKLPNAQEHPEYLKIVKDPISMLDIKGLIKQRYYKSVDAYMSDVFKLIRNNRLYFSNDGFIKDNLNVLEANISRLYQIEMSKPDSDYLSGQQTSKFPLPYLIHQGRTYKVGNWVLMKNPNDTTRPIVGQIFRIWQEEGKQYVNVCWYYRPEWTVHRSDRLFLENEVVKTGQYRDHLVDDIVGPCYVAYFTRWLKGDPGLIYEGPLFICEFRYNDREMSFAKIRTWKACLPDEVRHIDDPVKPLENPRVLKKFPSPIKHLLAPGSTSKSPIPQPIILNLNAPPLVGAVYVKRDNDEEDLHYFDDSLTPTQFKTYIPPTTNIRLPSSAIVDTPTSNEYYNDEINLNNININSALPPPPSATVPQYLHHPSNDYLESLQANTIPMPSVNNTVNNSSNHNHHLHHNISHQINTFKAMLPPNNGSSMNLPTQHSTYHKIIQSPYNILSYQFSPYHQASSSDTFVQPSGKEHYLQKFVRVNYLQMDKSNFERVAKTIKQQGPGSAGNVSDEWKREGEGFEEGIAPLIWFKGPPLNIADRILDDQEDNKIEGILFNNKRQKIGKGIKYVKIGHSAEYLAWKLKKKEKSGLV